MNIAIVKGFYKNKPITAILIENTDTIHRFQYDSEPGRWFFPLIENGKNVERDKFKLDGFDDLEVTEQLGFDI